MKYPPVVIVDEHDRVVGAAPLTEAWQQGLRHRIVFIILRNMAGEVLLQKRAASMLLYPGRWEVSAGGHVDISPDYAMSAQLELQEELGLHGVSLKRVAHLYTEEPYDNGTAAKRFITIFEGRIEILPQQLGESEVSQVAWWPPESLQQLASEHPEQIAEGLHRCLPYIAP